MEDQTQPQQMLPIWAIVIIVVVVIALIAIAVFCMKKNRSRSLSVDTIHRKEDEKKSMSASSFQTLVTQKQKTMNLESEISPSSITASLPQPLPPALPSPAQASIATAKKTTTTAAAATAITPQSNEKTDKPASDHHESDYTPPEPPQEIKISLPLPPPSASFFSDKMELDGDDAQDFYAMYLNSKSKQDNSFISIDLDMPSFYSNVQQKAATIKSTLRQSLRVKQKSNRNSVQQLFSDEQYSSNRKSGDDATVIVPLKQDSPKVVIDIDPPAMASTPLPPPAAPLQQRQQRQDINIITQSTTNPSIKSDADESPITPNPNLQEPVRAAKRVIRSASKKTKTRSMVITDPTATGLTEDNDENGNGKRSKHGSIRYASIRGPKSNGEHMTITSGSMRRLVRESILFDDDALPLPSSAAIANSSSNTAASSSIAATAPSTAKKSVVNIAGWWDTPKTSTNTSSKPVVVAATTEHVNENHLPLNITSGLDSTSSNTPNQYRASLSASIFAGTLSKASGSNASLFSDLKDEAANHSNGSVSRHGSFRRGTLGRNTLRSITATATNGVNRSLKGLFDYSSSTSLSNKVVPDDSQKTELDSEPAIPTVEGNTEDKAHSPPLNVIRQKSVRTPTLSSSNRAPPPVSYLKTSEFSTKYALTGDEHTDDKDESSKKTALDDMAYLESPTLPQGHYDMPSGSNKIEAAAPSIEKSALSNFAQDSMPNSPMSSSTTHKGEVDTIRRMLQDTWITNMKESASSYSMLSEADSVATTSTQSTVSSKLAPRQQQSLLSRSLLTQQVAKRASLLARHNGEEEFIPQQSPEPSASFSSSTVRTMVPANESAACGSLSNEPVAIRQNAINSKMHGSNKIQESSYDDKSHLMSRFSTSSMTDTSGVSSPRNSIAESSRGHSRKSSGGNSAATALRISSGYSANAKTWNGRAQKWANRPSVAQQDFVSPDDSLGRSSVNKKFFSTMRKGQKTRGSIPWMMEEESSQEKTPAQIERDRYLEGGSIL